MCLLYNVVSENHSVQNFPGGGGGGGGGGLLPAQGLTGDLDSTCNHFYR